MENKVVQVLCDFTQFEVEFIFPQVLLKQHTNLVGEQKFWLTLIIIQPIFDALIANVHIYFGQLQASPHLTFVFACICRNLHFCLIPPWILHHVWPTGVIELPTTFHGIHTSITLGQRVCPRLHQHRGCVKKLPFIAFFCFFIAGIPMFQWDHNSKPSYMSCWWGSNSRLF